MGVYRTLAKELHINNHSEAGELYAARFNSEAALRWDFTLHDHPLFCLLVPEIYAVIESIYQREHDVQAVWNQLPGGVRAHYLRALLVDEVVSTNDIEGVISTRKDIRRALSSDRPRHRFREFAHLYEALASGEATMPATLEDIRRIYDKVLAGETVPEEEKPDGNLFRAGTVIVEDTRRQRTVHHGFHPEDAINSGLREFLRVGQARDLVSAIIGHLMFEVVHPFYDGNGRTGRYLLGVHVSSLLSPATALTLSREINGQKAAYYRAFTETENPLNRAEATHFVLAVLKILDSAQEDLLAELIERSNLIAELGRNLRALETEGAGSWKETHLRILFVLGQVSLFGDDALPTVKEIAALVDKSDTQTRRDLNDLEELGLIEKRAKRPLLFSLTDAGKKQLGLPGD